MKTLLLILLIGVTCFSCTRKEMPYPEYVKWLDDGANGLVKTRNSNGFTVTVKYLPPEYMAFQEVKGDTAAGAKVRDSLFAVYSANMAFLMTIGIDESKRSGDVMMQDIAGEREFAERSAAMNFGMEKLVTLTAGTDSHIPVLSTMENVYGLRAQRSILLVFSRTDSGQKPLHEAKQYDFTYTDELFGSGIHHFVFSRKDIERIPRLTH
jgi:hypothetical protein